MNDRDNDMLGWIGAGIAFALMMQVAPFHWAVYALMLWLAALAAQDWMSEHQLPPGDKAVEWRLGREEAQSDMGAAQQLYSVGGWVQNRGSEALESAVLKGRLYECASPDNPIGRCVPVAESRDLLTLDLKPGFRTHFTVYPSFRGAGGPNPRVTWTLADVVADRDWDLD